MSDAKRDFALLKAWNSGSTSAGEKLFSETYEKILRYVGFLVNKNTINRQDIIEEITNEAFTRAYNKIEEYNGSVTFYTWIRGFAGNCTKEQIRGLVKEQKCESIDSGTIILEAELSDFGNPEHILVLKEQYEALRDTLISLQEDYRQILDLRLIKGLKYKEISALTGKHEDNLESLFIRALRAFVKEFKKRYEKNL